MGHDVCIGVQTSVTLKVLMSVQVVHCILVVTGFRACGIIHIKWPNLHFQQAQQRISPQPFDMLSIGIGEHKVNQTGKLERTYITRHAKAEQDPFAALANLLAHEIDNNGFSLIDMLQSGSIDSETCQQLLWGSRVSFPNIDTDNSGRTSQIESLLESVVKEISGWDKAKDKHTGLFRKTAANNALAAGAASDEINRYFGWKSDVQRRFYAQHHSEAYINIQAVLAGFHKDSWKQNHHLGRAAVDVDEAWCEALLPGLSATAKQPDLSVRRKELNDTLLKLAEAFWQALPIKKLKYGLHVVAGLPRVQEVMHTDKYTSFSDRVLQAECDSMEKLQMMQEVPYLAEWQQANYVTPESQQVAYHSDQSDSWETRQQSQIRSAEAAEIVTQETVAKRQKVAHSAADKEQQMLAELEQLRSERRQTQLQLQIDTEKQAMLELHQQQRSLRRRQLMLNAQGDSALTAQVMSASTSYQVEQPQDTPVVQNQAALSVSGTAEDSTVPASQPSKVKKVLKSPDMFKAQTIDGRYQEWVGGGQYAGIKGQLVMNKNGLGLPRTKGVRHAKSTVDNLRKKRCLPEAIEQLTLQGLTSDAAIALVTHVVTDFDLRSISTQSEAFYELVRLEEAIEAGDSAEVAAIGTKKLCRTSRTLQEFKAAYDLAKSQALVFIYLL